MERINLHRDGRLLASPSEQEKQELADFSVTAEQWGKFLCSIFDEWVRQDVGLFYIQTFDSTSLTTQYKACEFLFACNGECPKNRFIRTINGETGLNDLCKGCFHFSQHVAPYMDFMRKELKNKRPPANVMDWAKDKKTNK